VILAIDQGTTGTTCLVIDGDLRVRGRGYVELHQHFPHPGWVEHDPEEIWAGVVGAAESAVAAAGIRPAELRAIGITNQRETTILWERASGRPVAPAIVWQDRRTADRCRELPADLIRARTGLVTDPYFSATKLEWLLARTNVPQSELAFGTVDSWIVWKLTNGRVHATDLTNASRTLLLGLDTLDWDDELLELFGVDRALLPQLVHSSGIVGEGELLGVTLTIAGIAGDQQASLFGHGCFERGEAKATYGTGSFILANVGETREPVPAGLLETVSASGGFALEGAVLVGGAAIQWLRDGLGLLGDAAESEELARSVAALGRRGARPHHRRHARNNARSPRARGTRGNRVPGRRRARRPSGRRRRPACRRRRNRQRVPDAVPGGPARLPDRRRGRTRDDCARGGRARGPGGR
jgi:glycerol kinase